MAESAARGLETLETLAVEVILPLLEAYYQPEGSPLPRTLFHQCCAT